MLKSCLVTETFLDISLFVDHLVTEICCYITLDISLFVGRLVIETCCYITGYFFICSRIWDTASGQCLKTLIGLLIFDLCLCGCGGFVIGMWKYAHGGFLLLFICSQDAIHRTECVVMFIVTSKPAVGVLAYEASANIFMDRPALRGYGCH